MGKPGLWKPQTWSQHQHLLETRAHCCQPRGPCLHSPSTPARPSKAKWPPDVPKDHIPRTGLGAPPQGAVRLAPPSTTTQRTTGHQLPCPAHPRKCQKQKSCLPPPATGQRPTMTSGSQAFSVPRKSPGPGPAVHQPECGSGNRDQFKVQPSQLQPGRTRDWRQTLALGSWAAPDLTGAPSWAWVRWGRSFTGRRPLRGSTGAFWAGPHPSLAHLPSRATPWRALEQGTVSSPSLRPTARAPGTASRRTDLHLSQGTSCSRAAGRRRGAGSEPDSGSPNHLGHPLLLTQGPHGQGPSPPSAGARV